MNILFFLFFFCTILFAQINVFEGQNETLQKEFGIEEQTIFQNIAPSDESTDFEIEINDPFISQSSLVLQTNDYPNRVFVGEVFPIVLNAKTTENTNFDFNITVEKNKDLEFLNPNPEWERENGSYKTTLWFEAKTPNALLEQIHIQLLRNKQAFQEASIHITPIKFELTTNDKNYSHLVASFLEIVKAKTNIFDDENLIMMLELNAKNTNLKSFFIDGILKQGIENVKGDFNSSNGFYYAILPNSQTHFTFSYYNKENKKLEDFTLKLEISDEELSTQSDLNPTNKNFNAYKKYGLWVLVLLLAILFLWLKNFFILILALAIFTLSFLLDTNTQTAILRAGTRVKILPTNPSTFFYIANSNEKVEILNKRQNYVKILFQNGQIGWVQNVDLQKN
ncbi:hypothetical protein OQH60_01580 [Campylobacter sp. MIT 21-1685]|uniref:hypothetical protein n=1 Tax=unclassified Campylobacter TaxID=2593542 RepID=UPI00224A9E29|nr:MULTISPECIES: hypothetical protein [unclassified Campylobacter]MCX2682568.1 hypothetical protein [Campylobacter sp. MIT 21-1684]MCX2750719.1 hypothetical protein [Campylobacter sp. MIT 21-1682]MCX2807049.1 hypothetical protein [Campylobacter sp. MIT 21-1685]